MKFSDEHMKMSFKKTKTPSTVISSNKMPKGRIVLDDELSRSKRAEELKQTSNDQSRASLHSSHLLSHQTESYVRNNQSAHSSKVCDTKTKKHDLSQAKTSVKSRSVKGKDTETGSKHTEDELGKEGDMLEESNETNSLLAASNLINKEFFKYLYEEDGEFKEMDMKGMESLMKMDKEMDNIMIESNDDDMIKSSIKNQLDALEQITKNMVQREELKKQCDHMITGFKEVNDSVVNLPDDYKNVSERMAEEILEERKLGIFKVSETEKDGDSDFRRTVRSKLKSTFYGFAQQEGAKDIVKKNLDDEYLAGLERLRKLDIILKEKEMEEKAVKEMLKLERQKARLLEEEVRMKDSRLSCASKESSQSSSKSEVFLTQGKKSRVQEKDKFGEKKKAVKSISVQDISVNEAKEGGSVSGDGLKKGIRVKTNTQKEKHDDEFIKKNIRTAFVAENPHEIFLIQMDEKTRKRYDELLVEIENMEDSDALTKKYFDDVYGKDELQDETFEELDERIRKELAEESLSRSRGGEKDVIRERVEQKEMKRKLKELNERIDVRAS